MANAIKKTELEFISFSQAITNTERRAYEKIQALFKENDFKYFGLFNRQRTKLTLLWIDASILNTIRNLGYAKLADQLQDHRGHVMITAYKLKRDEVESFYATYSKRLIKAIEVSPTKGVLLAYLRDTGAHDAFMLAANASEKLGLEMIEIVGQMSETLENVLENYEIKERAYILDRP
ncbi:MAG TPA: hypothetical protein VM581_02305 [Magnetospirillaceae bacterium]|nr:hypothetical protein [Magnetospirillaceae bacterium]